LLAFSKIAMHKGVLRLFKGGLRAIAMATSEPAG
jgi:hypothetical protein